MSFYHDLTPYYEQIFPANPKQIQFIQSYLQSGARVLDVGAGTGCTAEALASMDYTVTATEPEPSMYSALQEKESRIATLTASNLAMQQVNQLQGEYDGIYCIGNTLVHLNTRDEVQALFHDVRTLLRPDGKFIIQIVNVQGLEGLEKFDFLPLVKDNFVFDRKYDLTGEKIQFTSTITAEELTFTNTIALLRLTYADLRVMFEHAGFHHVEAYSDFEKTPFRESGQALIIVAE
ncbi:class I SAM-dependent methyltransferase [Paenibacillus sp. N1-5-1-14]|uniref:class I SAM-dependent methyltransferase n=1 Tax=Paenibacillus radicibacter TaxID=2972488 RepID=UPI002159AE9F|nr:class I SAM-dependent methyltransferase [Paenibacillus radicibacter]MCR8644765.1 class I SAM-dependent methyltransferase [Paenibacillus radicibacter]